MEETASEAVQEAGALLVEQGREEDFFQDLQSDQGFGRQGEFPDTPVFPRGGGRRYPLDAGGRGSIGAGGGRGIHLRRRDGSCLTDPRLHVQAAPAADSSEKK